MNFNIFDIFKKVSRRIIDQYLKIADQYSAGSILFEVLLLPLYFTLTGKLYFVIKALLKCTSFSCYRMSFILSLLPSSFLLGFVASLGQGYFNKKKMLNIHTTESKVKLSLFKRIQQFFSVNSLARRTAIVFLFALLTSSTTVYIIKHNKNKRNGGDK